MQYSIPGSWPEPKADAQPLSHLGIPTAHLLDRILQVYSCPFQICCLHHSHRHLFTMNACQSLKIFWWLSIDLNPFIRLSVAEPCLLLQPYHVLPFTLCISITFISDPQVPSTYTYITSSAHVFPLLRLLVQPSKVTPTHYSEQVTFYFLRK